MTTKYSVKNAVLQTVFIFYSAICTHLAYAGGDTSTESLAALEKKSATILAEIKQKIGTATCESDNQCRALPVGHRACGGPAAYLVYSTRHSDETHLTKLAKQHTATERDINRLKNLMSTCDMLMPPPVMCEAGICISK